METSKSAGMAEQLACAANIALPWRATRCHVDVAGKMVHLWMVHLWITRHPEQRVIKKRNWLGMTTLHATTPPPPEGPDLHWRHLNCMDFTCTIHTVDQLDARHHDLPWFGQTGLPFSNGLSRQIFACLAEGLELNAICALFKVPFADLWKFKYGLDNGLISFDYVATRRPVAEAASAPSVPPRAGAAGVPDVSDPVWEQLLTGALVIQIKTLGFQLLLTKLMQQVSLQQNDDVKLLKLRELHRYVERNARSLGMELDQLRSHAMEAAA